VAVPLKPGVADIQPDWRRKLIEAVLAIPDSQAKEKMTYEEFLAWADEDTLAEWVDGMIQMSTPATRRHQEITGFLQTVISIYVRHHNLGVVLAAPFQMKLTRTGREPDVIFVATAHLDRLHEAYLDGPADLVIEVLSPESIGRDRGEKFYEYAQGGVPEYWLVDPDTRWIECYRLTEGRYYLAFEGREGQYHAAVIPGFWLRAEWLWQDPLPDPLHVLGEIVDLESERVGDFVRDLQGKNE
jgi:Uma2 family endonuclease